MTRIEVLAPMNFHHKLAQHCFLRFPTISLLDSHPFTVVSAPQLENVAVEGKAHNMTYDFKPQSLVFLARTRDGFTRRLADYGAAHSNILASAWIDGPYSGVDRPIERLYDHLIIVAGGSGITACVPWLQHILKEAAWSVRTI
jgi:predicted ferric reductase